MKPFAFLQCGGCRHFEPKSTAFRKGAWGAVFNTAVFVGMCDAGTEPEWLVWRSFEHSASHAGMCPDRELEQETQAECPHYDFTPETAAAADYPQRCIYFKGPSCAWNDDGFGT